MTASHAPILVGDKDLVEAKRLTHPYDIAISLRHEDAGQPVEFLLTELAAEHMHFALGVALSEARR